MRTSLKIITVRRGPTSPAEGMKRRSRIAVGLCYTPRTSISGFGVDGGHSNDEMAVIATCLDISAVCLFRRSPKVIVQAPLEDVFGR